MAWKFLFEWRRRGDRRRLFGGWGAAFGVLTRVLHDQPGNGIKPRGFLNRSSRPGKRAKTRR